MEDYVLEEMKQILKTAIQEEETSKERYLRGAEISLTSEIQELFRILANEEERHVEKLKTILKALEEDKVSELSSKIALRGLDDIH
jgi:rubrerythrin